MRQIIAPLLPKRAEGGKPLTTTKVGINTAHIVTYFEDMTSLGSSLTKKVKCVTVQMANGKEFKLNATMDAVRGAIKHANTTTDVTFSEWEVAEAKAESTAE